MKTFKIFSTAALALMMAACSSEDAALNNSPAQQQGRKVHFTATIAAPGGNAGTRTEYTEVTTGDAAGTINVVWKAKDEIALIHNGTKDVVTVETVNEDGSATITGDITVGTNGEAVTAYYPAAAIELNNDKNPVPAAAYTANLLAQDGTLSYIASNLDLRSGESTIAVDGDKATLSDNVKLASQIAIWKLTLQDDAETPAALSATQVSVKLDGETPVTIASTAKLSTATSSVYLAMPEMAEPETTVTIEAVTANGNYTYVNSGLTLAAGKYYQSTVTMAPAVTDLSTLTDNYTAKNGETLTGTLNGSTQKYKISIAAGATVTLDNATINGVRGGSATMFAGINCEGDATIILKDGTTNTVKGFSADYPGIYVPKNKTLTIKGETAGTGKLTASSSQGGNGAGIGGGMFIDCGNIEIQGGVITAYGGDNAAGIGNANYSSCGSITISGGTITANGGEYAAGIGTGYTENSYCGDITISGGTVTATGGENGAGIGTGKSGSCNNITISGGTVSATGGEKAAGIGSGSISGDCGNITITTGVTKVTATKGSDSPNSIGAGYSGNCGTVTIGCTLNSDGNPIGGTTGFIETSPYTYDPNAPVYTMLSAATSSDCGKVVCAAGHLHDAKTAVPSGCTAVGILGKVTATGHGLILALQDATSKTWNTINGWTSVTTYASTTLKLLPDNTARGSLASYTTLGSTTVSNWCVAQKSDYEAIFTNLGSTEYNNGRTYDDANVNAYITTGVGGTAISGNYWSATVYDNDFAWSFGGQDWGSSGKSNTWSLRPVLGF